MAARKKARKDLAEELARTEGEPSSEEDQLGADEIVMGDGTVCARDDGWRDRLLKKQTRDGIFTRPVSANVVTYLRYHPRWAGVVAYDEFREAIVTTRPAPWAPEDTPENHEAGVWSDEDTGRLVSWIARAEGLDIARGAVEEGLAVAAHCQRVHAVRNYLEGLTWDGVPRCDAWLATYLGATDDLYTRGVGPKWLISAVARIMRPGCQADCTLVFEGLTGIGKTSCFRALMHDRDWYAESGIDVGNKDSLDALRGKWLYLFDELDSLRKGEITRIKTFLTSTHDHYRPAYARRARDFARQNIFGGTTNEDEYFVDRTGNRRFWPVRCVVARAGELARDRDQIWAEAVHRYRAGEAWHVDTPALRLLCEEQQSQRMQIDPWLTPIAEWLRAPSSVEVTTDGGFPSRTVTPIDVAQGVTTVMVLTHCIKMRTDDIEPRHAMRVGSCLRDLGYVRTRVHEPGEARSYRYLPPAVPAPEFDGAD